MSDTHEGYKQEWPMAPWRNDGSKAVVRKNSTWCTNIIMETGKGTALGKMFCLLSKEEYRKVGVDLEGLPDRGRCSSHTEEGQEGGSSLIWPQGVQCSFKVVIGWGRPRPIPHRLISSAGRQ